MVKRIETNYQQSWGVGKVRCRHESRESYRGENGRDTELLDTILKDKLEFAYKSQRLERQLAEKGATSSRRIARPKEKQQLCAKSNLNVKTKKKFQPANASEIHDINQ